MGKVTWSRDISSFLSFPLTMSQPGEQYKCGVDSIRAKDGHDALRMGCGVAVTVCVDCEGHRVRSTTTMCLSQACA
jgi:hypothetical protein